MTHSLPFDNNPYFPQSRKSNDELRAERNVMRLLREAEAEEKLWRSLEYQQSNCSDGEDEDDWSAYDGLPYDQWLLERETEEWAQEEYFPDDDLFQCNTDSVNADGSAGGVVSPTPPLLLNGTAKRPLKDRVYSAMQAHFDLHDEILGFNQLCIQLSCDRKCASPHWHAFKASHSSNDIYRTSCAAEVTLVGNDARRIGSECRESDRFLVDDAVQLLFDKRNTGTGFLDLTCNLPTSDERLDLTVCRNSGHVLSSFARSVCALVGATDWVGVWERQPNNNSRLHCQIYLAVNSDTTIPSKGIIEQLWLASLAPIADALDNLPLPPLQAQDTHIQWFDDFSKLGKYKHSYLAKRKQKSPRRFSDGHLVSPDQWFAISPELKAQAVSSVSHLRIPARGRAAALAVIDKLTEEICDGRWRGKVTRGQTTVTGYYSRFPSSVIPEITEEITSISTKFTQGPSAIPVEEALDFAHVVIHPWGHVNLSVSHLSLHPRKQRKHKGRPDGSSS